MRRLLLLGLIAFFTGAVVVFQGYAVEKKPSADSKAVEKARKTVSMLDDVYKQTVVLITDKYVHDEEDFAAGSAAVELFRRITEKGWHEVRLLDATGEPYDSDNVARDAFEREAIKKLKGGADVVDTVVVENGKPYLRSVTPLPVVMDKCVMCHPHYEDAKKGEPIGAISYKLAID